MKLFITTINLAVLLLLVFFVYVKVHTLQFIRQKTAYTNYKTKAAPDETEVYILGTVHKSTDAVGYDDLYNWLETIQPDIILLETDSTRFDDNMQYKIKNRIVVLPEILQKYRQSNLEEMAVQKYSFHHPAVLLRPYEWGIRDKFHKKYQLEANVQLVFTTLDSLNKNDLLKKAEKQTYLQYLELSKTLDIIGEKSLFVINTNEQDSIASLRQNIQYHWIKKIIDTNIFLKKYKNFYAINESYWDMRNRAMCENILKYIKLSPKKRIVVLNGFYHRYYLLAELSKSQSILDFRMPNLQKMKLYGQQK